ncbi:MAG: hypothetical protein E7614_07630 [Ruminococcaceae bacterium]|nr:hypothetical protein [Oscillospiraceae bacterium]
MVILRKKFFSKLLKSVLLYILSVITLLTSSCASNEESIVYSFEENTLTVSMYNCFYSRAKENMLSTYKNYYNYYGSDTKQFKEVFGFLPDGTDEYWEKDFWNETLTGLDKTARETLFDMTERACKEYLVYEKIAFDYGYSLYPEDVSLRLGEEEKAQISKYGSFEAWDIATIGQYGITAEEFVDIRIVSSYGTVLPKFIFGEKGEKISDEDTLNALSDSVQFMYSVYYFQKDTEIEEPTEDSSSNESTETSEETEKKESESNEESEETPTIEEYNKHYKELMYSDYEKVLAGEKTFEDVYKMSDEYKFLEEKAPNGVVLQKEYFNSYFSLELKEFKKGDIIIAENEAGIFMIKFVDFTSEYIADRKSKMIDTSFEKILKPYLDRVEVNEDVLLSLQNLISEREVL